MERGCEMLGKRLAFYTGCLTRSEGAGQEGICRQNVVHGVISKSQDGEAEAPGGRRRWRKSGKTREERGEEMFKEDENL